MHFGVSKSINDNGFLALKIFHDSIAILKITVGRIPFLDKHQKLYKRMSKSENHHFIFTNIIIDTVKDTGKEKSTDP